MFLLLKSSRNFVFHRYAKGEVVHMKANGESVTQTYNNEKATHIKMEEQNSVIFIKPLLGFLSMKILLTGHTCIHQSV